MTLLKRQGNKMDRIDNLMSDCETNAVSLIPKRVHLGIKYKPFPLTAIEELLCWEGYFYADSRILIVGYNASVFAHTLCLHYKMKEVFVASSDLKQLFRVNTCGLSPILSLEAEDLTGTTYVSYFDAIVSVSCVTLMPDPIRYCSTLCLLARKGGLITLADSFLQGAANNSEWKAFASWRSVNEHLFSNLHYFTRVYSFLGHSCFSDWHMIECKSVSGEAELFMMNEMSSLLSSSAYAGYGQGELTSLFWLLRQHKYENTLDSKIIQLIAN